MASTRHSLAALEGSGALFIAVKTTTAAAGTVSVSSVSSPQGQSGDVTWTKNSTGNYTLAIANFKGPYGVAIPTVSVISPVVTVTSSIVQALVTGATYSGDTLSITLYSYLTSNAAAANAEFNLHVLAY